MDTKNDIDLKELTEELKYEFSELNKIIKEETEKINDSTKEIK